MYAKLERLHCCLFFRYQAQKSDKPRGVFAAETASGIGNPVYSMYGGGGQDVDVRHRSQ